MSWQREIAATSSTTLTGTCGATARSLREERPDLGRRDAANDQHELPDTRRDHRGVGAGDVAGRADDGEGRAGHVDAQFVGGLTDRQHRPCPVVSELPVVTPIPPVRTRRQLALMIDVYPPKPTT